MDDWESRRQKNNFSLFPPPFFKKKSQRISFNSWKNTERENPELADTGFGRTKEMNTVQQIFFKNKSCKIKLISFLEKVTSPGDREKTSRCPEIYP